MRSRLPALVKRRIADAQLPVEYEIACKALAACSSIDEAKTWADKSDALAAWAKIYKSDRAALEARRLKLHAYRPMGELARELRPQRRASKGRGTLPGPRSLLLEHGLTTTQAQLVARVSNLPESEFEALVMRPIPPTPNIVFRQKIGASDIYNVLMGR